MFMVIMVWSCTEIKFKINLKDAISGKETLMTIGDDSPCRRLSLRDKAYEDFIALGLSYGWQQAGTYLFDNKSYCYNHVGDSALIADSYLPYKVAEFKLVHESDAAAWAEALERAYTDLEAGTYTYTFARGPMVLSDHMTDQEFLQTNRATDLDSLREFIDFLKKGRFAFFYDD